MKMKNHKLKLKNLQQKKRPKTRKLDLKYSTKKSIQQKTIAARSQSMAINHFHGYVDCCNGVWRIHGSLAVSRGIGDQYLKQWVIAKPETRILSLNHGLEFLILALDGLWDKVSNQEAVDIVRPLCINVSDPEPLSSACKKLVDLSTLRDLLMISVL